MRTLGIQPQARRHLTSLHLRKEALLAETMKGREYLEAIVNQTVSFQEFSRTVDLDLKISALIFALEKLQRIRRSKKKVPDTFSEVTT